MSEAPINFRDFELDSDLEALRVCFIALQDHERTIYRRLPTGEEVVDECIRHMLENCENSDGRVIVAEVDGEIGGFITVLCRVISEDPDDGELEYALISDLVVLDRFRGKGVGRRLMEFAESHARSSGAKWLRVGVISGNASAEKLYASFGFTPWYIEHEKALQD